jgi:hypothetical protein
MLPTLPFVHMPDWKVWKLRNRDLENLIVSIYSKHQHYAPDISVA